MAFPDRLQLPLSFDPVRLARDLEALSATPWTAHYVQQNYEGDWSVIPLRCAAGETHPIRMIYSDPTATAFVDTPFLEPCPYFRDVIAAFACEVRAVRLMRWDHRTDPDQLAAIDEPSADELPDDRTPARDLVEEADPTVGIDADR